MKFSFDFLPSNEKFAACCFVVRNDKILCVSRRNNAEMFGLPGGKLEKGENFLDACIRETKEETGLTIINPEICFGDICGRLDRNETPYYVVTYKCDVVGEERPEKDLVIFWKTINEITELHNTNSFHSYNKKLIERILF